MIQAEDVFRRELVVVYRVICRSALGTKKGKGRKSIPSSIYDGCLKVATCIKAKRYFAKSLSGTAIRACSRFLVSAKRSPFEGVSQRMSQ